MPARACQRAGVTGSATHRCSTSATAHNGSAGSGSNAGTYAITASAGNLLAANYDFTTYVPGTLTVTRALLTTTADSLSRLYGAVFDLHRSWSAATKTAMPPTSS